MEPEIRVRQLKMRLPPALQRQKTHAEKRNPKQDPRTDKPPIAKISLLQELQRRDRHPHPRGKIRDRKTQRTEMVEIVSDEEQQNHRNKSRRPVMIAKSGIFVLQITDKRQKTKTAQQQDIIEKRIGRRNRLPAKRSIPPVAIKETPDRHQRDKSKHRLMPDPIDILIDQYP